MRYIDTAMIRRIFKNLKGVNSFLNSSIINKL
jgi:hypothetical protein